MALPEDASPAAEKFDESEPESDQDDNSGYKSAEGIANPHFHNRTVGDLVGKYSKQTNKQLLTFRLRRDDERSKLRPQPKLPERCRVGLRAHEQAH